jgi:hypothetical protein
MTEECNICMIRQSACFFINFECCNNKYCSQCVGDYFYKQVGKAANLEDLYIKCPTIVCKNMHSVETICRMKLPNIHVIMELLDKKKQLPIHKDQAHSKHHTHPIVEQIINALQYLLNTIFDERCPECGKFNTYNNSEVHRRCPKCNYEYCRKCFQCYTGYRHSTKAVCGNRRLILFFCFIFLIISLLFKPLTIVSVHKAYDYLSGGAIELGLSLLYVISHFMWLGWFDELGRVCRGYGTKPCVFIFFLLLCIYELLINYIWHTYQFYPYLYKLFLAVVVFVENMINAVIIEQPLLKSRCSPVKLLFAFILFAGPAVGAYSLIIDFHQSVFKIMVLMIPFCALSGTLHISLRGFEHALAWIARLIILAVIAFVLYKQKSWVTIAMSCLLAFPHFTITFNKIS